jgi:hypothetical protein
LQDPSTKIGTDPDGIWSIHTHGCAFVELRPNLPIRNYRLTVEMRPNAWRIDHEYGIYFGHRTVKTDTQEHQFCLKWGFTELSIPAPKDQGKIGYNLGMRNLGIIHFKIPDFQLENYNEQSEPTYFSQPTDNISDWRKVSVTVRNKQIEAIINNEEPVIEYRLPLNPKLLNRIRKSAKLPPNFDISPRPEGGLGFYVYYGSISVRFATIEPLTP